MARRPYSDEDLTPICSTAFFTSSTDAPSSSVVRSPIFAPSQSPLSTRRMTLPERVLGSILTNWTSREAAVVSTRLLVYSGSMMTSGWPYSTDSPSSTRMSTTLHFFSA